MDSGEAYAARESGGWPQGRGRDVPRVCARWDAGHRAGRHLAQVTFISAPHCSSRRLAPGRGWQGCPGAWGDLAFLGRLVASACSARSPRWGREQEKVVTTLGTATLLLMVRARCCLPLERSRKKKKNVPGKPLSEMWRLEGTDLGALCQVLFVLGITSLDYCLTTSPSLPQSLSPPPVLAAPGFALWLRALRGVGSVCVCVGGACKMF